MNGDRAEQKFRLLTIHNLIWSLAMSLAGGFIGAYLLGMGFSVAQTLCIYSLLLTCRLLVRVLALPVIRRIGIRAAMLLGAVITSMQFLPLIHADKPACLAIWIALVSLGECVYWPIYHAANATYSGDGRRGRQIAWRQMGNTTISLAGPMAGALLLTRVGAAAEFGLATMLCLASVIPLCGLGPVDVGAIPTIRGSLRSVDGIALRAFVADGWMSAGCGVAWPIILFTSLGASFSALGWASSVASLAGSLAGLGCGIAIDRGHRTTLSRCVTAALLAGIALRAVSAWAPWTSVAANTMGAAVGGLYCPMLMSAIYDRAKQSGSAYQFHLAIEAGWDTGALFGCLAAAAIAASGAPISLSVLPSALGLMVVNRCMRTRPRTGRQSAVASADETVLLQAA